MEYVALSPEELPNCIPFFHPNRPVLVTTCDRDGAPHVAPFAWCVPTSWRPPMISLALLTTPRKQHSLANIEREGEFVVNFPNHDLAAQLVHASYRYPAGVRKAGFLALEFIPPQRVHVPAIAQCRAHVECRLRTNLPTGDHTLLVADVVAASCIPELSHEDWLPDLDNDPPCLHLGHRSLPDRQIHRFIVGEEIRSVGVPFNLGGEPGAARPERAVRVQALPGTRPSDGRRLRVETTVLATGFTCPDGPCADPDSGDLIVLDWASGRICRISRTGIMTDFADTGGMPAGACPNPQGGLLVCDPGRRAVLAISPEGTLGVIASGYRGQSFLGPVDCAFGANGDFYFTDADGWHPLEPSGCVYLLRPDGAVELFAEGFSFPKGLAVTADGRYLYLAETFANRVHRFVLDEQGRARDQAVFAELDGGTGPDGLALDARGNLYAAHFGKGVVAVLSLGGELLAELPVGGALPTNVAFWDGALCVTELENGSVLRFDAVRD